MQVASLAFQSEMRTPAEKRLRLRIGVALVEGGILGGRCR
jgi:hypothetical protein